MLFKKYGFRAASAIFGILLVGLGVGLFRMAVSGCDPFTTMNLGISGLLGLQFGTLQLGVSVVLLLLIVVFRRGYGFQYGLCRLHCRFHYVAVPLCGYCGTCPVDTRRAVCTSCRPAAYEVTSVYQQTEFRSTYSLCSCF
ncbi:MAG: hypothetical protein E7572_13590 [Ruminococcaceae bacterium]|nr:hypothetical protein [Oscillospiraceae bacterium]